MQAVFIYKNGSKCIGTFADSDQVQEQILDAFETAKQKNESFYLGAFPFENLKIVTGDGYEIEMSFPWIMSSDIIAWEIKESSQGGF